MQSLLSRTALAVPLAVLSLAPAHAISVNAGASVGFEFFELLTLPDLAEVSDEEALSIELSPGLAVTETNGRRGVFVDAEASLDDRGTTSSSQAGAVTLTNTLSERLSVTVDVIYSAFASVTIEEADEVGEADGIIRFAFGEPGDGFSNGAFVDLAFEGEDAFNCFGELPCTEDASESQLFTTSFSLDPGGSQLISLGAEASVVAVAPIPLPAAAGPAVLVLGGLAWAGRRRRGFGLHTA